MEGTDGDHERGESGPDRSRPAAQQILERLPRQPGRQQDAIDRKHEHEGAERQLGTELEDPHGRVVGCSARELESGSG